jgi:hypothetical protein
MCAARRTTERGTVSHSSNTYYSGLFVIKSAIQLAIHTVISITARQHRSRQPFRCHPGRASEKVARILPTPPEGPRQEAIVLRSKALQPMHANGSLAPRKRAHDESLPPT